MIFLIQVLVGTGEGDILKSSFIGNKKVWNILIFLSIYFLFSLEKMEIFCFNYKK